MTGNETIERSIASMREKMDRDNAALAASQAALATSQATLASNQAALASNLAALNERVHLNYSTLVEKINTSHLVMRDKFEEVEQRLGKDLGDRITAVDRKFDAKTDALSNKIDALATAFAELRSFHKIVVWVCGGIVTLVTVSLSVGKTFGWI